MKITVFEGNKGDCLLISSEGGKNILVDGGLVKTQFGKIDSYSQNVAMTLNKLRTNGGELDLVCVSHIDQDHIVITYQSLWVKNIYIMLLLKIIGVKMLKNLKIY